MVAYGGVIHVVLVLTFAVSLLVMPRLCKQKKYRDCSATNFGTEWPKFISC